MSTNSERCEGCDLPDESVRQVRVEHTDGIETIFVCEDCKAELNARVLEEVEA